MAKWCLVPEKVKEFKKALKDREIDPAKLSTLSSEERHKLLSKFVGDDNALNVNSLFESKLLLKNQKAGYISWAKKVTGITPEARKDLISRIEKMDKVLSPQEGQLFLKDLAETRLGVGVSQDEAKQIFELSNKVKEARANQQPDLTFKSEDERLAFGRSKVALANHVNDLKGKTYKQISINPVGIVSSIAGNAKSIKASLDNSAIFRQGWKTLMTNPLIWTKNAPKTFADIYKTFKGKPVMDEIMADIISRPTYDLMSKAKLAIGGIEEAFPGTIAEKLPVLGRAYKASENAYTGFLYRTRADVFDKYIQIAQKSGVELNNKELKSIGSLVNSLTGRANLGSLEKGANVINNIFFSPRFVKSQFDTVGHVLTGAGGSSFVRKQAAVNLVKIVSGAATILTVANIVKPGSVELDPRSADFGKIRIGNTRFDVTGGLSGIVTLAARLAQNSTKSSTTGEVTPLNTGKFGAQTSQDQIVNFFNNKLSPVASVIEMMLNRSDREGNPITPTGVAKDLFLPLGIANYEELKKDPNSPNAVISTILDGLGISANTYLPKPKKENDWAEKPTKAQEAFLGKIGQDKFKEANLRFNAQYEHWLETVEQTDLYSNLPDTKKNGVKQSARQRIQDQVFKDYGFDYKEPRKTREDYQLEKDLEKVKPKKVSQGLLDRLIPSAYASEGESNDLFGSSTTKFDFKTGKTETTVQKGIISRILEAVSNVFKPKEEAKAQETIDPKKDFNKMKLTVTVDPKLKDEQQIGQAEPIPSVPVSKSGEIDFKAFHQDQNGAKRKNFSPSQPPQDVADVIKKHFGNDYAAAVLVASTENAQFDSKRADNVNTGGSSRDRGIFQINSDSFNGLMERQGAKLKAYGITSYDDMYDPDKNAYVAKLIKEGSKQANPQTNGWGAWYGWQDTGYNINNGWFSAPKRIDYELAKKKK